MMLSSHLYDYNYVEYRFSKILPIILVELNILNKHTISIDNIDNLIVKEVNKIQFRAKTVEILR